MLPQDAFEAAPGVSLTLYSVEHLLWDNPYREHTPAQVVLELANIVRKAPNWRHTDMVLARRIAERYGLPIDEETERRFATVQVSENVTKASNRGLVEAVVRLGHGLGLGAPWGVSAEADILWAAAATLTRGHGCTHPSQLP